MSTGQTRRWCTICFCAPLPSRSLHCITAPLHDDIARSKSSLSALRFSATPVPVSHTVGWRTLGASGTPATARCRVSSVLPSLAWSPAACCVGSASSPIACSALACYNAAARNFCLLRARTISTRIANSSRSSSVSGPSSLLVVVSDALRRRLAHRTTLSATSERSSAFRASSTRTPLATAPSACLGPTTCATAQRC
jgi:hypothetical protein